jgi:biotin synthase
MDVDASIPFRALEQLKAFGIRRIDCSFGTFNPEVFGSCRPGDDLESRKRFALSVGDAGLKLGVDLTTGLGPDATRCEDYVDALFSIKKYGHLEHLRLSRFEPEEEAASAHAPERTVWECACQVAVARLVLRDIDITAGYGWKPGDYPDPLMAGCGNRLRVDRPFSKAIRSRRRLYGNLGLDIR